MNPIYEFEDIDDYLHDRMSESDRKTFEQVLEQDADLVQRVEALRAESKVFRLLRDEYVLEQFAEWKKEDSEKKNTGMASAPAGGAKIIPFYQQRWIQLAAAASVVGLVAVGVALGWFGPQTVEENIVKTAPAVKNDTIKTAPVEQPEKSDQIADKNTTPTPTALPTNAKIAALSKIAYLEEDFNGTLMGIGDGEESTNNYTKAVKLYSENQYKAALKLLERPDSNQLQENLYLRGYTYYHLHQYVKAGQDFRAFRDFRVSDRKVDAVWCEVFCLVKQLPGSRKQLDAVLLEITANPRHTYYQRAVALQKELKQ
jgi:hypothetical protein